MQISFVISNQFFSRQLVLNKFVFFSQKLTPPDLFAEPTELPCDIEAINNFNQVTMIGGQFESADSSTAYFAGYLLYKLDQFHLKKKN